MGFFTNIGKKARGVGYRRRKTRAFRNYSDEAAGWPSVAVRKSVQRKIRKDDKRYIVGTNKPRIRRRWKRY